MAKAFIHLSDEIINSCREFVEAKKNSRSLIKNEEVKKNLPPIVEVRLSYKGRQEDITMDELLRRLKLID